MGGRSGRLRLGGH
ncbi:hypothetical protein E2320_009695, partial [Naja naja]